MSWLTQAFVNTVGAIGLTSMLGATPVAAEPAVSSPAHEAPQTAVGVVERGLGPMIDAVGSAANSANKINPGMPFDQQTGVAFDVLGKLVRGAGSGLDAMAGQPGVTSGLAPAFNSVTSQLETAAVDAKNGPAVQVQAGPGGTLPSFNVGGMKGQKNDQGVWNIESVDGSTHAAIDSNAASITTKIGDQTIISTFGFGETRSSGTPGQTEAQKAMVNVMGSLIKGVDADFKMPQMQPSTPRSAAPGMKI